MHAVSYRSAVNKVVELAPSLDKPGEFIRWAEDICELLSCIYSVNYEEVTENVFEAVKEEQGFEDEDE